MAAGKLLTTPIPAMPAPFSHAAPQKTSSRTIKKKCSPKGTRQRYQMVQFHMTVSAHVVLREVARDTKFAVGMYVGDARKFGDVVLKYIDPETQRLNFRLVSIAHVPGREREESYPVLLADLTSKRGPFSLVRHFQSFYSAYRNAEYHREDREIRDVTVVTNSGICVDDGASDMFVEDSGYKDSILGLRTLVLRSDFDGKEELVQMMESLVKDHDENVKSAINAFFEKLRVIPEVSAPLHLKTNSKQILSSEYNYGDTSLFYLMFVELLNDWVGETVAHYLTSHAIRKILDEISEDVHT